MVFFFEGGRRNQESGHVRSEECGFFFSGFRIDMDRQILTLYVPFSPMVTCFFCVRMFWARSWGGNLEGWWWKWLVDALHFLGLMSLGIEWFYMVSPCRPTRMRVAVSDSTSVGRVASCHSSPLSGLRGFPPFPPVMRKQDKNKVNQCDPMRAFSPKQLVFGPTFQ